MEAGYYHRLQNYHKTEGNWKLIERGIYRITNYPDSPNEHYIPWSLWSCGRRGEPQATISHQTAASIDNLGDLMPAKVHLTVPKSFRKKPAGGCVLHKAKITPAEREFREGFFITKPLRTVIDLVELPIEGDHLNKVVEDMLRRGMIMRNDLIEASKRSKPLKKWLAYFRVQDGG